MASELVIFPLHDKLYPFFLVVLFFASIVHFVMLIRYERNISKKSIGKIVRYILRENDETFATLLSLMILTPIYFFTFDKNLGVEQYIAITVLVLLFFYSLKLIFNYVYLRKS